MKLLSKDYLLFMKQWCLSKYSSLSTHHSICEDCIIMSNFNTSAFFLHSKNMNTWDSVKDQQSDAEHSNCCVLHYWNAEDFINIIIYCSVKCYRLHSTFWWCHKVGGLASTQLIQKDVNLEENLKIEIPTSLALIIARSFFFLMLPVLHYTLMRK